MEFSLSKEQKLIQKIAGEFAQKYVEPIAEKIDKENIIPEEIINTLGELGLLGIPFAEEYGGSGAGYQSYVLALEQIAKCSAGVGVTIGASTLGLGAIDKFGTEEQKQKYMPPVCRGEQLASFAFTEPGTGSDPKQIQSTAQKDGEHYILNGTKRFITNGSYHGPIIIFARDTEVNNISAFIVDKFCEGYSASEPWKKLSARGGKLVDVYLDNVRVPEKNLLGERGQGFPILLASIALGKIGTSTCALGDTLAAFEEAVKYSREKLHREQPIARFQAIQLKIADLAIKYETARWICYRLGYLADNMKDMTQFAKEAALVKSYLGDNAVQAARIALEIHGSYGLMEDYKVSRIYKDAILGSQIEGVSDMQKLIVAGNILK
jgi:alkylation response protein AidB-like acyl-CoA dehydrogenase